MLESVGGFPTPSYAVPAGNWSRSCPPPAQGQTQPAPETAGETVEISAASSAQAPSRVAATISPISDAQRKGQLDLAMKVAATSTPLFGIGGILFPDSHGKIEHLALQLGNVEFGKPLPTETHDALMGVWTQLFNNMSPDTRFSVVCADQHGVDSMKQLVQETHIAPARVDIIPANTEKGMSIWIRDSMLPSLDAEGKTKLMIQDRTYWPGPEDNKVAPLLAETSPNIYAQAHPALRIDGGNVISNHHLSIVGPDSIDQTRDRLKELAADPAKLDMMKYFYEHATGTKADADLDKFWADLPKLTLSSELQRPILTLDAQPAFHIDMAVTPIGDKKFLVGDPRMAIDAFNQLSPEDRAKVNDEMIKAGTLKPGDNLIDRMIDANSDPKYIANYDTVADNLKDAGFEVERIPAMIGLRTTWSMPYLTYNNCIMEIYQNDQGEEVKNVYLPQYGCQPLDDYCTKVYEKNGYNVTHLQMSAVSKLEGAIRCSSYALERGHLNDVQG